MSATFPQSDSRRWPVVQSAIGQDPAIEHSVAQWVSRMTLAQKIGQMIQPEILAITPEQVKEFHIGSVLNGGGSWPGKRRDATAKDWVALADAYYDASMDTTGGPEGAYLPIPVLWGTDAVHGHSNVHGATLFPHNIGLGAARDPDLLRRIGAITAREVAATGLDWTFAPTLAVVRNDRWGRTYEGYSEHPEIVHAYGGPMVEGIQGRASDDDLLGPERVLATAKHFLGDGGTTGGVDQGNTQLTEEELIALHAQGYLSALAAGAQTVMVSFSSWNGTKMHGNPYLLTEVLRGPLGFDGLVVGDWNGHGQVPGCSNDSCPAAILAGVDMLMVPFDWKALIANTLRQVSTGEIPESRIDEAVTRILRVKMRAGLMGPHTNRGRPSSRPLAGDPSVLGATEHRQVAREAVQKSLVLLKNKRNTLPLARDSRILLVGQGAHDIGLQSGGWTLTWQGTETTRDDFPNAQTLYEGLVESLGNGPGEVTLSTDGSGASTDYDAIVAVIGETPYAEGQGDIRPPETLAHASRFPDDLALLERIRQQAPGVPVITVLLTGRPLYINPELNRSDALVVAWLLGGEGGGVADVLLGEVDFHGTLSFSWPARDTDADLSPEHSDRALFPYGYGLGLSDPDPMLYPLSEERTVPEQRGWSFEVLTRGSIRNGLQEFFRTDESMQSQAHSAITANVADGRLQNSARRVRWDVPGDYGLGPASGQPVDVAVDGRSLLTIWVRVVDGSADTLRLWGTIPAFEPDSTPESGVWHQISVTDSRLKAAGLDPRRLVGALHLTATAPMTIDIEEIAWKAPESASDTPEVS